MRVAEEVGAEVL
jgi:hypothetical protein